MTAQRSHIVFYAVAPNQDVRKCIRGGRAEKQVPFAFQTAIPHPHAVPALTGLIFFASGFAALVYQIVWQRLLVIFSGSDVHSATVIVAAFMAGLGCGHLAGAQAADRRADTVCLPPLRDPATAGDSPRPAHRVPQRDGDRRGCAGSAGLRQLRRPRPAGAGQPRQRHRHAHADHRPHGA